MEDILKTIADYPIVPVYYNDDVEACKKIVESSYKAGIRVFEFVNRGPQAKTNFEQLIAYRNENFPDLKLGIGTIKTQQQALDFIALKADFIVSPIVLKDIAAVTLDKGILWIPGAMTPTEIAAAEALGAPIVKLFPGDSLGSQFVKAIRPLFSGLKFMVTGGVQPEEGNIKEWFGAGVTAVGMGSKLFKDDDTAESLQQRIEELFGWAGKN